MTEELAGTGPWSDSPTFYQTTPDGLARIERCVFVRRVELVPSWEFPWKDNREARRQVLAACVDTLGRRWFAVLSCPD